MLRDAAAAVLVTQSAQLGRLGGFGGALLRLDADWAEVARQPTTAPAAALDPQHPAYVIYTSGSTGTPSSSRKARSTII
jgi:non-ribosomal peptide synthetase component F